MRTFGCPPTFRRVFPWDRRRPAGGFSGVVAPSPAKRGRVGEGAVHKNSPVEIVDGRWGASLEIWKKPPGEEEGEPFLVYDLWNDPWCLKSLHKERPDLVKKYTAGLERISREHRALAKKFPREKEGGELGSEQLQTLKSLGYI